MLYLGKMLLKYLNEQFNILEGTHRYVEMDSVIDDVDLIGVRGKFRGCDGLQSELNLIRIALL